MFDTDSPTLIRFILGLLWTLLVVVILGLILWKYREQQQIKKIDVVDNTIDTCKFIFISSY